MSTRLLTYVSVALGVAAGMSCSLSDPPNYTRDANFIADRVNIASISMGLSSNLCLNPNTKELFAFLLTNNDISNSVAIGRPAWVVRGRFIEPNQQEYKVRFLDALSTNSMSFRVEVYDPVDKRIVFSRTNVFWLAE